MQGNMSLSHAGEGPAASAVCVHKPSIRYLLTPGFVSHRVPLRSGGDEAAPGLLGIG